MKIAKKKVGNQTLVVNIDESNILTFMVIMTLDPMRLTSHNMNDGHLKSGLSGRTNYSRH